MMIRRRYRVRLWRHQRPTRPVASAGRTGTMGAGPESRPPQNAGVTGGSCRQMRGTIEGGIVEGNHDSRKRVRTRSQRVFRAG